MVNKSSLHCRIEVTPSVRLCRKRIMVYLAQCLFFNFVDPGLEYAEQLFNLVNRTLFQNMCMCVGVGRVAYLKPRKAIVHFEQ